MKLEAVALSLHVACVLDYARGSVDQTENESDRVFDAPSVPATTRKSKI